MSLRKILLLSAMVANCHAQTRSSGNANLLSRQIGVMGTTCQIFVWDPRPSAVDPALLEAENRLIDVDRRMSTYKPDSDLSRVNQTAGTGQWTDVGSQTIEVLNRALAIGAESGGLFDVTVGPLVRLWDFYTDWQGEAGVPPTVEQISVARALVDQTRIQIDHDRSKIRLSTSGMVIDFGAIAKGYALDQAADSLRTVGIQHALLDLGGQIAVVGSPAGAESWSIGIRHPRDPDAVLGLAKIDHGSLSTSGDYQRYFIHEGRRYSHLVDPTTGWPVTGLIAVTVWAPTAIDADAWSTALFIAGEQGIPKLIDHHPELGVVLVVDPGDAPLTRDHIKIFGQLRNRVMLQPSLAQ